MSSSLTAIGSALAVGIAFDQSRKSATTAEIDELAARIARRLERLDDQFLQSATTAEVGELAARLDRLDRLNPSLAPLVPSTCKKLIEQRGGVFHIIAVSDSTGDQSIEFLWVAFVELMGKIGVTDFSIRLWNDANISYSAWQKFGAGESQVLVSIAGVGGSRFEHFLGEKAYRVFGSGADFVVLNFGYNYQPATWATEASVFGACELMMQGLREFHDGRVMMIEQPPGAALINETFTNALRQWAPTRGVALALVGRAFIEAGNGAELYQDGVHPVGPGTTLATATLLSALETVAVGRPDFSLRQNLFTESRLQRGVGTTAGWSVNNAKVGIGADPRLLEIGGAFELLPIAEGAPASMWRTLQEDELRRIKGKRVMVSILRLIDNGAPISAGRVSLVVKDAQGAVLQTASSISANDGRGRARVDGKAVDIPINAASATVFIYVDSGNAVAESRAYLKEIYLREVGPELD